VHRVRLLAERRFASGSKSIPENELNISARDAAVHGDSLCSVVPKLNDLFSGTRLQVEIKLPRGLVFRPSVRDVSRADGGDAEIRHRGGRGPTGGLPVNNWEPSGELNRTFNLSSAVCCRPKTSCRSHRSANSDVITKAGLDRRRTKVSRSYVTALAYDDLHTAHTHTHTYRCARRRSAQIRIVNSSLRLVKSANFQRLESASNQ
jgi:hypothetical protein